MMISRLGEFALIERFKKAIKNDSSVIKGPGDDCAVIKFNKDNHLLFSCDMIVEDVDFLAKDKPELIGRKALAISISDIASCGGIPRHCLVSLGMPRNESLKKIDGIFRGILGLGREYKINLVGGDLSRANKLTIDVSILGSVEKKCLVLRSGAEKGDIIFVSGRLGGSYPKKHLEFSPRLKEARFLVKNFKVNAMIDISDGLTQDLGHILEESKAGAIIYEELIPLSHNTLNLREALCHGEDYELLFCLSRKEAKKILAKRLINFKPIGEIVDRKFGLRLIDKMNREIAIKPQGFRHF